jgi:uncharacterized membrane protein
MSRQHLLNQLCRGGLLILAALFMSGAWQTARAELKLCNGTSSKVGVAIGYKDKDGWTSEGWWNVDSQACSVLIQDKLRARFYYVYAFDYDKGGEWGGQIPMCTAEAEFTIRGIEDCDGRKYKRSNFFEVDTQEQADWTVKLTEQPDPNGGAQNAQSPAQSPSQGLQPQQAAVAGQPGVKRK